MRHGRSRGSWAATGAAKPHKLAVTLPEAAEVLALPLAAVERLAWSVKPYQHQDGSERWPVRELARVLADCGPVRGPWP